MECELKYALENEAAYLKLQQSLGQPSARLFQQNIYLEVPNIDLIGTLRLRSARNLDTGEEKLSLTYKIRHPPSHLVPTAYFVAEEYETPLDRPDWDSILKGEPGEAQWNLEPLKKLAESCGRVAPIPFGGTDNLRLVYPGILPGGSVAELDRTEFPGHRVDYELEVETDEPQPIEAWAKQRFEELGLTLKPQTATKNRRFVEQMTALREASPT